MFIFPILIAVLHKKIPVEIETLFCLWTLSFIFSLISRILCEKSPYHVLVRREYVFFFNIMGILSYISNVACGENFRFCMVFS